MRDCPLKTNEVVNNTPQMAQHPNTSTNTKECGHCNECGVKHLFQDCPRHPDRKGKATINLVEVIPSSSGSDTDKTVPIKVVTRAQAQKQNGDKNTETDTDSDRSLRTKPNSRQMRDKYRAKYHKKLKDV